MTYGSESECATHYTTAPHNHNIHSKIDYYRPNSLLLNMPVFKRIIFNLFQLYTPLESLYWLIYSLNERIKYTVLSQNKIYKKKPNKTYNAPCVASESNSRISQNWSTLLLPLFSSRRSTRPSLITVNRRRPSLTFRLKIVNRSFYNSATVL